MDQQADKGKQGAGLKTVARHILFPLFMTAAFFGVAFTPVALLGCRNRGLIAFAIALVSGILSISASIRAIRGRIKGEQDAVWWIVTALLMAVPVVAMLKLA
jgi:hypothetical protein